jgi:hypothetical protein
MVEERRRTRAKPSESIASRAGIIVLLGELSPTSRSCYGDRWRYCHKSLLAPAIYKSTASQLQPAMHSTDSFVYQVTSLVDEASHVAALAQPRHVFRDQIS